LLRQRKTKNTNKIIKIIIKKHKMLTGKIKKKERKINFLIIIRVEKTKKLKFNIKKKS
jgi:hypothetical protein